MSVLLARGIPTVAFLALTAFYVFHRIEMLDEGWYLQAGRRVWQGDLPYRDFAYFQAPLLPYLHGASQRLLGPGLLSGRALAAAFAAGTWILTLLAARRLAGPRAVPVVAWAFVASVYLTSHFPIVLTYAPAAFFLAAAADSLLRGGAFRPVLFAAIAAGIRLSLLPAVPILAAAALRAPDRDGRAGRRVLAGLAVGAALFAAFVLPDPGAAAFDLVGYHTEGATPAQRLRASALSAGESALTLGVLLVAAGLAAAAPLPRARWLVAALAACFAANLVPVTTAPYYHSALLPLLALLAGATLARVRRRGVVAALLLLHLAAQLEPARRLRVAAFDPDARPLPFEHRLPRLREVADDLRAVTTPESRIFTLAPYFTVEADRDVMRGLEMSIFAVQFRRTREECARTRTVNPDMIREWFTHEVPDVVLLTSWELQYLLGREGPILSPLREGYAVRTAYERVGQFDGRAFLLTRRRPGDRPPE